MRKVSHLMMNYAMKVSGFVQMAGVYNNIRNDSLMINIMIQIVFITHLKLNGFIFMISFFFIH